MRCVSNTAKTSVSSGVTWNSQSSALGPGGDQAVSSRLLGPGGDQAVSSRLPDQRQRVSDGWTCGDSNMTRRVDGSWQNGAADDWELPTLGVQHSIRYCGALPWRHWCTVTPSLC